MSLVRADTFLAATNEQFNAAKKTAQHVQVQLGHQTRPKLNWRFKGMKPSTYIYSTFDSGLFRRMLFDWNHVPADWLPPPQTRKPRSSATALRGQPRRSSSEDGRSSFPGALARPQKETALPTTVRMLWRGMKLDMRVGSRSTWKNLDGMVANKDKTYQPNEKDMISKPGVVFQSKPACWLTCSIAISFAWVGPKKKNQAATCTCDMHAQIWKKFGPRNMGHLVWYLLVKETPIFLRTRRHLWFCWSFERFGFLHQASHLCINVHRGLQVTRQQMSNNDIWGAIPHVLQHVVLHC